jgi:glycosyltransferase involved in cell wall biosynthesis
MMKTLQHVGAADARPVAPAVRVCMHVLGKARTDIRAMRAATTLIEAGYAVSIVDIVGESQCAQPVEDIEGVRVKHLLVPDAFIATRFKRWALIRALLMFIRCTAMLVRTQAEIYHALDLPAFPACYIAARLHRKPLIFESYELPLSTIPLSEMSTSRRWLHALLAPLLTHMIPRCAGVIAVSSPIVEEMRKRYRISKVSLIRNIPEYRGVPKSDRLRQHLGMGPEVRIALYQGNIQPDRELDKLVLAASYLEENIAIVMMGGNVGSTQSQLEALIESQGVAHRVKIIPPVPYGELLAWTASADLGLTIYTPAYSPNVQMMLPNKLFEYLMSGLPVLTSSIGPIVEVVGTYDVGKVVPSLAPADIGAAINTMLTDPPTLARWHRNALEAAKELCWENEKGELVRLYQTIQ